jgi:hypothetical protein
MEGCPFWQQDLAWEEATTMPPGHMVLRPAEFAGIAG